MFVQPLCSPSDFAEQPKPLYFLLMNLGLAHGTVDRFIRPLPFEESAVEAPQTAMVLILAYSHGAFLLLIVLVRAQRALELQCLQMALRVKIHKVKIKVDGLDL